MIVARAGHVFAAANEDDENKVELSQHYVRFVPPSKEKGTLGFVAFGYKNNPFSDESAMNEAGLFYDFDALDKLDKPREGKPKGKFNAINEMLTHCHTVKEAMQFLEGFDLPNLSSAQMVIGDATGASAIFERQATTWRPKKVDYQIGTNFRTSTTPTSQITCDRFKLCDANLVKKKRVTVDSLAGLLNSTKATGANGSMTWYSLVCDLKSRQIHLYRKGDFTHATTFSLDEELKKGQRKLDMDEFIRH